MNNAQLLRDSEPIRLLETPRSLSEYILIVHISPSPGQKAVQVHFRRSNAPTHEKITRLLFSAQEISRLTRTWMKESRQRGLQLLKTENIANASHPMLKKKKAKEKILGIFHINTSIQTSSMNSLLSHEQRPKIILINWMHRFYEVSRNNT